LAVVQGAVETELTGEDGGVAAAVDTKLGQDPGDMDTDGLAADEQLLSDLPIRSPLNQQVQHLTFTGGQATVRTDVRGADPQVQPTSAS
jgi:hypothetical protein